VRREAFAFAREFPAAPPSELRVDRHYLLCASRGALRLEAQGKVWLLPPARAALIAAGEPIQVAIPQPVITSSVLFDPVFAPEPPASLTVFDLTPLARALVTEPLEKWELTGMVPTTQLLVSELVTNAIRHAGLDDGDTITLSVEASDRALRIEVSDPGPGFAADEPFPDPDHASGWGLYLVRELSDRWGVERNTLTRVWFELDRAA